jgi:transposase-like protein
MNQRNNRDQKAALALAIAGGRTVKAWAKDHDVPERTAYSWARSPEVRNLVRRIQRRAIGRAAGCLSRNAAAAAAKIARLADSAQSESIQLQAARAVLAELMQLADYADHEDRIAELERRVHAPHPDR